MWAYAAHPCGYFFFYEKSIQKRIKEEVSSLISPRTENLSESFEEWNSRSILGDNDAKLYFFTSYNIVSPHSHFVTFPLVYHESFMLLRGDRRGHCPLLPEIQKPEGFWCVFGNFLHTRKLPRCGARSSIKKQACWNFALRQSVEIIFWLLLQTIACKKAKVFL